jgi:Zn ribbon nucleic-acid-binding protein
MIDETLYGWEKVMNTCPICKTEGQIKMWPIENGVEVICDACIYGAKIVATPPPTIESVSDE